MRQTTVARRTLGIAPAVKPPSAPEQSAASPLVRAAIAPEQLGAAPAVKAARTPLGQCLGSRVLIHMLVS